MNAPTTPPMHYGPQIAPRNGFGTTALVLGITGAGFALVPVVGVIAWPLVILGLIFGVLGIQRARTGAATNKGAAIAGTATSAIGLLICIIWTVSFAGAVQQFDEDMSEISGMSNGIANGGTPMVPDADVVSPSVADEQSKSLPLPPPEPGTISGSGTFLVGIDIEPGTYRSAGPVATVIPNCYWARHKDASGDMLSIIANDNSQGPAVVKIAATDGAFETNGCQTWKRVQ